MALHQRALPKTVSHYSRADIYGWLPLTAAYLKTNQLQPALALLQHAVAHCYSRQLCSDSAPAMATAAATAAVTAGATAAAPTAAATAARQLAAQWSALVMNVIRDGAVPGGLTQLLFPLPQHKQLGTSQVMPLGESCAGAPRPEVNAV